MDGAVQLPLQEDLQLRGSSGPEEELRRMLMLPPPSSL
jgi:hypothetical protein